MWSPPYNSADEIRRRSGLVGNFNISTASISSKITITDGMVNGFVGGVYSLPLSETCSIIKELAGELAEALILKEEYGPEVADSDKDGQAKFEAAVETLRLIQTNEMKLFGDFTYQELTANSGTLISGYPDDTSDQLTSSASTAPVIRMGDTY